MGLILDVKRKKPRSFSSSLVLNNTHNEPRTVNYICINTLPYTYLYIYTYIHMIPRIYSCTHNWVGRPTEPIPIRFCYGSGFILVSNLGLVQIYKKTITYSIHHFSDKIIILTRKIVSFSFISHKLLQPNSNTLLWKHFHSLLTSHEVIFNSPI